MKNLIEAIKNDKKKKIVSICVLVLLIIALMSTLTNIVKMNKLKKPDKAVGVLMDTFYKDNYDKKLSAIVLGKSYKAYFGEKEKNTYTATYDTLKNLGDGVLVNNKTAIDLANEYTDESMKLLKRVKKYEIVNKEKIDGGYRFTISVTPTNLGKIYQDANECAVKLEEKTQKEDAKLYEKAGYQYPIYYYCLTDAIKKDKGTKEGTATTINVIVKKNSKGQYIPDESSKSALMSAAY